MARFIRRFLNRADYISVNLSVLKKRAAGLAAI